MLIFLLGVVGVALAVLPQPVGLEDVLPTVLDDLGPAGAGVRLRLPDDLPEVTADPGLVERILANVLAEGRYGRQGG